VHLGTISERTPVGTCQKILKEDLHLFPYRLTAVQELHVNDLPQRLNYCQWFLNTIADDVLEKTFFTDEAIFICQAT
jgi:hypothetical protein